MGYPGDLLDSSNPYASDNPLVGEDYYAYDARRNAIRDAQSQQMATQAAQTTSEAQAQTQRDNATTAKAFTSQGLAGYTASDGSFKALMDPWTKAPMQGSGAPGGVAYDSQGGARRVSYPSLDAPKLTDAYAPEAGGSTTTDAAGNTYKTAPDLPHQWTGVDPDAQAQAQAKADADALKQQQQAADYQHQVASQQVATMTKRLAGHQLALDGNAKSLSTIPELADVDLDGDGVADSLEKHFASTGPEYNATSGFFGGGGLTAAAQSARDDLSARKTQAQTLLTQRGRLQRMQAETTDLQAGAQNRVDLADASRAKLAGQRAQAAGLPSAAEDDVVDPQAQPDDAGGTGAQGVAGDPSVSPTAKRVTVTDTSKLSLTPFTAAQAKQTAAAAIRPMRKFLAALGVKDVLEGRTEAESGIEVREDGVLLLDHDKLAVTLSTVRRNQARLGINSTPADYFAQVLAHEATHAADVAVARANGQTIQERYEALPTKALPDGWDVAGRHAYGADNWDKLPEWKQKAEFVRQVVEGKWTGRVTEQLYKFIRAALDFLKRAAGFENTSPEFRAHVEEVESRINAAEQATPDPAPTEKAPTDPQPGERVTHGRKAAVVQSIEGDTATIQYKAGGKLARVPAADLKPPVRRSFLLSNAPHGVPDILDAIQEQGGILSPSKYRDQPQTKPYAGEYDNAPGHKDNAPLGGVYHHAVFGGTMAPDDMAAQLHENEEQSFGDGTPDTMFEEVNKAIANRQSSRSRDAAAKKQQAQAARFDRDATDPSKTDSQEIEARSLQVGDTVHLGGQAIKVIAVSKKPGGLITLEDHSKYGIQQVHGNDALYVEKVEPGTDTDTGDASLAAASPEDETGSPRLRPGEKGTGDLFQGEDQPFNLVGETAIDHGALAAAREKVESASADARAQQERGQGTLFAANPEDASSAPRSPDPSRASSIKDLVDRALTPGSGGRKQYADLGTVSTGQAAQLKADTGLDLTGYRRNLDNMAVRHAWLEHGDAAAELARGNAPLSRADFEKVPQVLAQPDASILAGKNSRGQDVILHAKRENGYYIVAEEVRDNRGILNVSTLYKKSAPPLARAAGSGVPDAALLQSNARDILQQAAASFKFLRGRESDGPASLAAAAPEDETALPAEYHPATVEQRRTLKIPPAWTDVHVAADPAARRLAVGKDGKGRVQSLYSADHVAQMQADKFARLTRFDAALPEIMRRVGISLQSGEGREEASALRLIHASGFRNGGDEDTGAKVKAYGASNLRAEHVAFDGDTTHFDFTGKLGVRQQHSITDSKLTADLKARAAKGGALFNTNDARVRNYLKQHGGDFKVHDFRTWNATDLARKLATDSPAPTSAEQFWNARDAIGDQVAKKLGDTRKIVLESYIDPAVFEPWKSSLDITDENRPPRAQAKAKAAGKPLADQRGGTVAPPDEELLGDDQLSR